MHARADCSPANAWHAKSNTNPTGVISPFTFSPGNRLDIKFAAASPFGSLLTNRVTISAKPVGVGAASQRLIWKRERSGLLMRTAATDGVSLSELMKS